MLMKIIILASTHDIHQLIFRPTFALQLGEGRDQNVNSNENQGAQSKQPL